VPGKREIQGFRVCRGIRSVRHPAENEGGIQKMATQQFDPNRPSGIGADDGAGTRWITQGPWKFDPLTKELLPGQIPTEVPPEARVAPVSENAAGAELPREAPIVNPFEKPKRKAGRPARHTPEA